MSVGKESILRATNANKEKKMKQEIRHMGMSSVVELSVKSLKEAPERFKEPAYVAFPMEELKKSIEKYGILEPVIVTGVSENEFMILSGEKRVKAALEADMELIPCIVLDDMEESQAEEIYKDLHKNWNQGNIHEAKFQVISSIKKEIPDYLL